MYAPDIIALLEDEVSVVEDTREESVLLDVYLQDALDIHELYIIYEYEARMADDDRLMTHEHDASIKINYIENNLSKEIIHCDEEYREEYVVTELRRKYIPILIEYPSEDREWYEEEYELEHHKKHENPMATVYLVICRHIEWVMI